MKQYKIRIIFLLSLVFLIANSVLFYVVEQNKKERVEIALNENLKDLQTHYNILLHNQTVTADGAFYSTTHFIKDFIPIMQAAQTASPKEKNLLRKRMYNLLKEKYKLLKKKGVVQYHIVLPDNESFLRMHKPSKFGDNLTEVRKDFKYTNTKLKIVRGFTQGRTAHGFRNTYPIFSKEGEHLGAMEISFSSDSFQEYLTNVSDIHTHFLVNKHIFDTNTWKRDDLVLEYMQSVEHPDFMIAINGIHSKEKCITQNRAHFKELREDINRGIKSKNSFSLYTTIDSEYVLVASFFPIKNLEKTEALAWLVSYERSSFIYITLQNALTAELVFTLLFFILAYLSYSQLIAKQFIKQEHKMLNDVLNATDDIMFMTNTDGVSFSNRKFKEFFNVNSAKEFNKKYKSPLDTLVKKEGYLDKSLILEGEDFENLIQRTAENERAVLILNKHLTPNSFNITVAKTTDENGDGCLVTLTDITKLKEKELEIHQKAYTDGLTGVYNRNKFDELILDEFQRNLRYKRSLSIAIVDIDHFKNFNDKFGHLIGDEVLIMLAQYINKNIRDTDIFARWGGEEFALLFPETSKQDALLICDKLRVEIANLEHKEAGSLTVSFGVTQYEDSDTVESIFKRCDEALYRAKESGRNRVCVA